MRLKDEILKLAQKTDACPRIRDLEACCTDEQVVKLMFRNFDFCASHHFPPLSVLAKHSALLQRHGVYVNNYLTLRKIEKCAIIGNSLCRIEAADYEAPIVYVKDKSRVEIAVCDNAVVLIEAFNDAAVQISTFDQARAVVILYNSASIEVKKQALNSVKIIDKCDVKR